MEQWKELTEYPGYSISSYGRVIGKYGQEMKQRTWNGYNTISLRKDGKYKSEYVHRLVGKAFIPNPLNKPTINHINHVRHDNHVLNLEWATYSEQNFHSTEIKEVGESGHRYIYKRGKAWRCMMTKGNEYVINNSYPTLEEALQARDEFLRRTA